VVAFLARGTIRGMMQRDLLVFSWKPEKLVDALMVFMMANHT